MSEPIEIPDAVWKSGMMRHHQPRLHVEVGGLYLGFTAEEMRILMAKGLIKPLGHPTRSAVKWLYLGDLQKIEASRELMSRCVDAIYADRRMKNSSDDGALDAAA